MLESEAYTVLSKIRYKNWQINLYIILPDIPDNYNPVIRMICPDCRGTGRGPERRGVVYGGPGRPSPESDVAFFGRAA